VGRRLLEDLEQGVEGVARKLVRLVEDEHPVAIAHRQDAGDLAQFADVVDAAVRGSVHLDDVEGEAAGDLPARRALAARLRRRTVLAVERLGEQARRRGLADAAQAGEQVGVGDLAGGEGVLERADDDVLADQVFEPLRPGSGAPVLGRSCSLSRPGIGIRGPGSGV